MRGSLRAGLLLATLAFPAHAANDDQNSAKALKQTRADLAQSKQRSTAYRKNLAEMQTALAQLQTQTGTLAAELQETEAEQRRLGEKLDDLKQQEARKQEAIDKHRRQVAAMLASAIRLGEVPPYAVLAMEGGIENEVHASRALALTSTALKGELDTLGREVAEITRLRDEITTQTTALSAKSEELRAKRNTLSARLDERKRIVKALSAKDRQEQSRIAALSKKATDLESFVTSLEAERKRQIDTQKARDDAQAAKERTQGTPPRPVKRNGPRKEYDLAAARGRLRLPASGTLAQSYGVRRGNNDTSRGMLLTTGEGAVVTAPYGGEVLFTGPFLDYGPMIIIRHSRQYHTLLAGLSRVDVAPGQFLLEGEPIGVMGRAKEERRLYIELRENGKPVDPAPWFGARALARK